MNQEGGLQATESQDTASSHPTNKGGPGGGNCESDGSWMQHGRAEVEEESNSPSATYMEQLCVLLLKLMIGAYRMYTGHRTY